MKACGESPFCSCFATASLIPMLVSVIISVAVRWENVILFVSRLAMELCPPNAPEQQGWLFGRPARQTD